LLQYRHQKQVQYEATIDTLEAKKEALEELERQEAEAKRLESALAAAGVPVGPGKARGNAGGRGASRPSLARGMSSSEPTPPFTDPISPTNGENGSRGGGEDPDSVYEDDEDLSASPRPHSRSIPQPLPPTPISTTSLKRSKPVGSGLLSALSHSIHGMIDVDPEAARRSNISKTKDSISQVRLDPILSPFVPGQVHGLISDHSC
jgi:hypothetical protein